MNDLSNLHQESNPHQEAAGNFVVPTERTEESSLLSTPEKSQTSTSLELTPVQQRKKDALELAELIYKIYNEDCPALTNKEDGNV
ncbi:MAG TPA: hypothetical protein VIH90_06580 [Candidatus Saccharimonadales bacterium]